MVMYPFQRSGRHGGIRFNYDTKFHRRFFGKFIKYIPTIDVPPRGTYLISALNLYF